MKRRAKQMNEKEFNLLHEPWILVKKQVGSTEEVSIVELFRNTARWQSLAGELPTQDIAILRLLLAILHAVFARYDLEGESAPITSPGIALQRWKALWERQEFPMPILEEYLQHYEERFYLFHPNRPFYQVAELGKSTEYNAAKLNGELSESNNKLRLFQQRTGSGKLGMCYAEAARWLININAFDDTASKSCDKKPCGKGLPSPGAGWLGKLGLITATGENLHETLLLNLIFLKDGSDELWGEEAPVWEAEEVKAKERTVITMPDNPSGLYTLQSRRLLLKRDGNTVVGYSLLGGDFFPKENALAEQMTLWRNAAKREEDPPQFNPRRHDPARRLWRDFPVLVSQKVSGRQPGVIKWLARLKEENLIKQKHFRFQTAAVKYGDKDFFVNDIFGDELSFNAGLITTLGDKWLHRIIDELAMTDMLAMQAGYLAKNLALAAGDADGTAQSKAAREQVYYRLEVPFCRWLEGIDPARDDDRIDEVCEQWWTQARRIVRDFGEELINQTGPQAFAGRVVEDKKKNTKRRYIAPQDYNYFLYRISTRETLNERRTANG
jgi:CRISPR system Cascade subunit CasA